MRTYGPEIHVSLGKRIVVAANPISRHEAHFYGLRHALLHPSGPDMAGDGLIHQPLCTWLSVFIFPKKQVWRIVVPKPDTCGWREGLDGLNPHGSMIEARVVRIDEPLPAYVQLGLPKLIVKRCE